MVLSPTLDLITHHLQAQHVSRQTACHKEVGRVLSRSMSAIWLTMQMSFSIAPMLCKVLAQHQNGHIFSICGNDAL